MSLNILNSSVTDIFFEFQGLKLSISLLLHSAVIIFVFIVLLIINVDRLDSMPKGVPIVILLYSSLFNLVGCILLFTHKSTAKWEMSTAITGCGSLSAITTISTFLLAIFYNNTLKISKKRKVKSDEYVAPIATALPPKPSVPKHSADKPSGEPVANIDPQLPRAAATQEEEFEPGASPVPDLPPAVPPPPPPPPPPEIPPAMSPEIPPDVLPEMPPEMPPADFGPVPAIKTPAKTQEEVDLTAALPKEFAIPPPPPP
ncbi:unnamed protein product [Cylicocyclus nassatus]|uniref:Uncharacterized protein n=1 Tax=Cylicocyclus nassatus TaxID=53992 RepID=A0AA36MAU6_CYLNA|nr:unnamed protein product [Cylicocyclus nassatus]